MTQLLGRPVWLEELAEPVEALETLAQASPPPGRLS